MSKKTKVVLEPGEAYVVATIEQLGHIVMTYRILAEQLETEEDKQAWRDLADHVEVWASATAHLEEAEDDDWN